ncbi:hypothetical protein [Variovorax sp. dw_954]|uniref:hypothetical protein n=1 Tax=Variovorax sp. dw_954 TaxID=2720078 RepID=UPI001BD50EB9|nr:hypothetical protein [Variovorax sp. dw_954]
MNNKETDWVANRLEKESAVVGRTPEGFLVVSSRHGCTFVVAVLGMQNVIGRSEVAPLFDGATKPQLVVNVPSKTLWSGTAIDYIHAASAAFGTFGDIARAADMEDAGSFRNKNIGFFINAMKQHSNVTSVSYIYESVFKVDCRIGASVIVAVIDAYNMSAEDVRNAKARFGHFDVVVKSSSYGSITGQAEAAAKSMGAVALTFRELMQWLAH